MRRLIPLLVVSAALAGCATPQKDVELELGEGGSAQLNLPYVSGVVHGPFRYKSTVVTQPAISGREPRAPEKTSEHPIEDP